MATAHGIFLSHIENEEAAQNLRGFFSEMGMRVIGPPIDRQLLLVGLNIERFSKLVENADIELVNEPPSTIPAAARAYRPRAAETSPPAATAGRHRPG